MSRLTPPSSRTAYMESLPYFRSSHSAFLFLGPPTSSSNPKEYIMVLLGENSLLINSSAASNNPISCSLQSATPLP
ncbi:hypothetical protein OGATHE_002382 [Ogataea polymorpha]|uniref:Uncharacterized protein n=1 Tax=Ogataea polymorpha TaxID=460523 RepID=A0A9P8PD95_9ASCO|nr:hypothetical protein OGATHE_002382 [Ogataea polymorpha]